VLLVGHSQGGLLAVRAADEWTRQRRFTVTHVVTAGSPVAALPVPAPVRVLSLENTRDPVPRLEAVRNPDRANHVTVEFDAGHRRIADNHALDRTYLPAARAVSTPPYAGDPSVRDWVDSADAFLAGEEVEVEVFDIRNASVPRPRDGE
ncbi:MAG: alpha/beta hydrolase, partial [Actinomycetota bacterium]|nr:alpha/beta hydrolase [Actinomycetota bacterium]